MSWGGILAGFAGGAAKEVNDLASAQIKRRDDAESRRQQMLQEMQLKYEWAEAEDKRAAQAYDRAYDAAADKNIGGILSGRKEEMTRNGFGDALPQDMADDLLKDGLNKQGVEYAPAAGSRGRKDILDELRRGGAPGAVIRSAQQELEKTVADERSARAAAQKEAADQRRNDLQLEREDRKDERQQRSFDQQMALLDKRLAADKDGGNNANREKLAAIREWRVDLTAKRAAANRARDEEMKTAYTKEAKAAVEAKHAPILKDIDEQDKMLRSRLDSVWDELGGDKSKGRGATGNVSDFVDQVGPAAKKVAEKLGVPVEAVIGQWGLETGWGKSVVPGTNNLGNIKDMSGGGVEATDNMTGSKDKYRKYGSVDDFADDFTSLVTRRYAGVSGSKDAGSYFAGLKKGGYAEDPDYVAKGSAAARMVADVMSKRPTSQSSKGDNRPTVAQGGVRFVGTSKGRAVYEDSTGRRFTQG